MPRTTVQEATPPTVIANGPQVQPEPLDVCLTCWVDWMHSGKHRDLGARTMPGLAVDTHGPADAHEAQHQRNVEIAEATDTCIEDMPVIHRWAIYRAHSMATAWRFPNANLALVNIEARVDLSQRLAKNTCTKILF